MPATGRPIYVKPLSIQIKKFIENEDIIPFNSDFFFISIINDERWKGADGSKKKGLVYRDYPHTKPCTYLTECFVVVQIYK